MCCTALHQLSVDAQAAVPTYLGLSVIVDGSDPPFTFTTLEDGTADNVRTSLRLTLPGVGDGRAAPSVALILYASRSLRGDREATRSGDWIS